MEMLLKLIGDYRSWPLLAALICLLIKVLTNFRYLAFSAAVRAAKIHLLVKGQIEFRYLWSKKK